MISSYAFLSWVFLLGIIGEIIVLLFWYFYKVGEALDRG
jgi:hypothetical protein